MNIMEHFGKRIINELYSYVTGLNLRHAKYLNFDIEDEGEFSIMNIYTDQAWMTIAIDCNGIEILNSGLYDDN